MKKKNRMRLKGQLRMYMSWPLIMTILLAAVDIWVYVIDKKAGFIMTVFILFHLLDDAVYIADILIDLPVDQSHEQ